MDRRTRKKKKGCSKVVQKIQMEQQVVDDTVMDLSNKDDDFHDELHDLHDDVMREMRCRTLEKKRENGGLSLEEQDELFKIRGC